MYSGNIWLPESESIVRTYSANNWRHLLTPWDFKKNKHICDDGCNEWFPSHQETWLVAFCNWRMGRSFGTKSHETGNTSHGKILFQSVSPNSGNIFTWMIEVRHVITPNYQKQLISKSKDSYLTPQGLNISTKTIPRPQHSVDISTDPKPSVSTTIFDPTLCRPHTWETCRNLEHSELCHTFARRSGREKNCIHSLYEFVWIFVCLKQWIVYCKCPSKISSMYLRF